MVHVRCRLDDVTPISINKAYTVARGRLILTREGKRFKDDVTRTLVSRVGSMNWKAMEYMVYEEGGFLITKFWLGFEGLQNKSWKPGKQTSTGQPSPPYRKKDVSNYIKLLEDALSKASGIDDANTLGVSAYKVTGMDFVGVEIQCHPAENAPRFETYGTTGAPPQT